MASAAAGAAPSPVPLPPLSLLPPRPSPQRLPLLLLLLLAAPSVLGKIPYPAASRAAAAAALAARDDMPETAASWSGANAPHHQRDESGLARTPLMGWNSWNYIGVAGCDDGCKATGLAGRCHSEVGDTRQIANFARCSAADECGNSCAPSACDWYIVKEK